MTPPPKRFIHMVRRDPLHERGPEPKGGRGNVYKKTKSTEMKQCRNCPAMRTVEQYLNPKEKNNVNTIKTNHHPASK